MAKSPAQPHPEHPATHDPLAAALGPSPTEKFIEEHKLLIVGGILAIVLGVSTAIWFNGTQEEAAIENAQAFSKAASLNEFNELIAKNPESDVAANALLRKAALLEDEGKLDEARAAFTEIRENHPGHPLVDQATVALARLAANANELDKADDLLSQVPSGSELAALAQLQMGDLAYRQGDLAKAKSIQEPIQANYPVNPWSQEVEDRLQSIKLDEAKAKTPPPVIVPTPPTPAAAPATPSPAAASQPVKPAAKPQDKPAAKPQEKPAAKAEDKPVGAPK